MDTISTISNSMFLYRLMLMKMFSVIIPGNTKYILHVIRDFKRAYDCLTGECNQVYHD